MPQHIQTFGRECVYGMGYFSFDKEVSPEEPRCTAAIEFESDVRLFISLGKGETSVIAPREEFYVLLIASGRQPHQNESFNAIKNDPDNPTFYQTDKYAQFL